MTRSKTLSLQTRSKAIASGRLLGGVEYDGIPKVSVGSNRGVLMDHDSRRDEINLDLIAPLSKHVVG